jgi:uncharacterized protein (TIGR00369 family)
VKLVKDLAPHISGSDFDEAMEAMPYGQYLGLRLQQKDGQLKVVMPFKPDLIGSPQRLHGGTVGAMLEIAGAVQVIAAQKALGDMPERFAKPISITIDYLRGGEMKDTYADAVVERMGRRVANVTSRAWQDSPDRLIATAHMHFLLPKK